MYQSSVFKKITAAALSFCIIAASFAGLEAKAAAGETLSKKVSDSGDQMIDYIAPNDNYYSDYLKRNDTDGVKDYSGRDLNLTAGQAAASDHAFHVTAINAGGVQKEALAWKDGGLGWIEWTVSVPVSAYYNIDVSYSSLPGSGATPQREMDIDGNLPFREANSIEFPLKWTDDSKIWVNSIGDQVRPEQKQIFEWTDTRLYDSEQLYPEPLKFFLTAGSHVIRLKYVGEPIAISQLSLTAPVQTKIYAEVLQQYSEAGYRPAQKSVTIEGEAANLKSDSSVRIESDDDPVDSPSSNGNVIYNAIGGTAWNSAGQSVTWNFSAPADGVYKLAFRYYKDYNDGMPTFRRIDIDGSVPFKEFESVRFSYGGWKYADVKSVDGKPYEVYLTKGSHSITLTSTVSAYAEIIKSLENESSSLSNDIQNIIKITGIDPDVNFDYELDQKLPGLIDDFKNISKSLGEEVAAIKKLADKRPSTINNLLMIKSQLDKMIKNPFLIGRGLKDLMNGQSTMSDWISGFQDTSMMIDYFKLTDPSGATKDYHSNAFQVFGAMCRTFFNSFVRDYDSVGSSGAKGSKTLNVWVAQTKEYAEQLQYIADEQFTKKTGINVKMNIVPANALTGNGTLLLAVTSGNAPDVALGVSSSVPFDYGIRGAVSDLTQFSNYKEVVSRFLPGIMIPFQDKNAIYALPETMDFSVLFYRKDILSALHLGIPDTWDELYSKVLPTLKKNGMDFFYNGGFQTFLYQNGGSYYTEDGLKSALDTPEGYKAFKEFTDLYRIYDVPVTSNFYSRFRSGQMPLGISSFTDYMQISKTAPELNGKWDVAMIPGVRQSDGQINRSYGGSTTAAMILKSSKMQQEGWEFLEWYTSAESQSRYAKDIVTTVGSGAMWCSANKQAFDELPWESNLKNVIDGQQKWYKDMPNVIGGYITQRYIDNARVRTVVQGQQYRESLEQSVEDINRELVYKNQEFSMRKQKS